jgi:beta-glucosidase
MDACQMIEAGGDSKLTYTDQTSMWSYDENSSADYHYGREAMHHLLYTVANSNATDGSVPGSAYKADLEPLSAIRIGINVVSVVLLALVGFTTWRTHKKRSAERVARRAASMSGDASAVGTRQEGK